MEKNNNNNVFEVDFKKNDNAKPPKSVEHLFDPVQCDEWTELKREEQGSRVHDLKMNLVSEKAGEDYQHSKDVTHSTAAKDKEETKEKKKEFLENLDQAENNREEYLNERKEKAAAFNNRAKEIHDKLKAQQPTN
ncbi:hypothetical protein DFA_06480 [Cavenderia fasciculata]|uniref:Uncharacterized protein n=1 Tax=Cavenderia fasciculata TaxID=261658 RepID=F4PJ44_CACFS|nr:uncharacterized protein DFA_06480 [Cavenderia fasciculata]EGG24330.1 hypothetical protein DFA_06480 [Cavenderia fasciculata]|eukprot:XP_004362181.1 hypothetical protein DFA_06480 [Cavenderia fasciculata]